MGRVGAAGAALTDAVAAAEAVRAREVSPVELVRETLDRISALQPTLNAFTVVLEEQALEEARAAERAAAHREELGPLHGVPVSVKDVLWVRGAPATNGSLAFRDFVPDEDAAPVARLRRAGAIVVGKTNNPELCLSGYADNQVYGLTRNPWDPSRTPGGSSGGAGAAVAAGLAPLALGTDAGGSIRTPASFCGVAGLKPSFGLVAAEPGFRGWRTLSVVGPLARSVRDLALCLRAIAGPEPRDPWSVPGPTLEPRAPEELRVAFSPDLGFAPLEPGIRRAFEAAVRRLAESGWRLEEAYPSVGDPTEVWARVSAAEVYAAAADLLERGCELEPRTVAILEAGRSVSTRDYLDAQEVRAGYVCAWLEFFERYDLLVTPTMQLTAFPVGLPMPTEIAGHPVDPALENWAAFCYPANLTGQPAASVLCGFDEVGLPVGLELTGRRFEDATVLRAAAGWEEIGGLAEARPPLAALTA